MLLGLRDSAGIIYKFVCFSSIVTEHHVGQVLMSGCDRSVCRIDRILHTAAFEILPRKTLEALVDGPVFGDICDLLPSALRK